MSRAATRPGIRRRFVSRFSYLTGQEQTGYGEPRSREITFDETKRVARNYFCTACGRSLPPKHLVDRNGQTTRLHLDCGTPVT